MNADLKATLTETGISPDFIAYLRKEGGGLRADPAFAQRVMSALGRLFVHVGRGGVLSAAASLVALVALGSLLCRPVPRFTSYRLVMLQREDGMFSASSAAPYVQAFAVTALAKDPSNVTALGSAVDALVADQRADGGWANVSVSALNAAALKAAGEAGVPSARKAYLRAARYLRARGVPEMGAEEFARTAAAAMKRLESSSDAGLMCPAALCRDSSQI